MIGMEDTFAEMRDALRQIEWRANNGYYPCPLCESNKRDAGKIVHYVNCRFVKLLSKIAL